MCLSLKTLILIFVQEIKLVEMVVVYEDGVNLIDGGNGGRYEDIICPKCTLRVPMDSLDVHIDSCQYTVCVKCEQYFPTEIVEDHQE